MFESIRELTESRLVPSKSHFRKYNLRDVADITFLYFLAIQILKHEFEFAPKIITYSKNVLRYGAGFKLYSQSGNDLYQLLYMLFNDLEQMNLKDENANDILKRRLDPSAAPIRLYLRSIGDKPSSNKDRRFLFDLEKRLVIQTPGYKNIRRLVEDWGNLNNDQRSLALTRLLQAFRARARRSELLPWLEDLAKRRRLEITNACNAETGKNCGPETTGPSILGTIAKTAAATVAGYGAGKLYQKWRR